MAASAEESEASREAVPFGRSGRGAHSTITVALLAESLGDDKGSGDGDAGAGTGVVGAKRSSHPSFAAIAGVNVDAVDDAATLTVGDSDGGATCAGAGSASVATAGNAAEDKDG